MVIVIKTSLAEAKAHLSELVDQAEHKKKRIVILRHGKPAAAIVPVEVAVPKKARAKAMTDEEVRAFFHEAAQCGDPNFAAVDDLVRGRR
jgi:prevent-host-death family protein